MPFLNITSNFRNLKFNSGKRYIPSTTPSFTTVLDLQTTLTSLQFGNDRPGYGSSGLPYIQTQIPGELTSPGLFKPIFRPTSTGNLDYPIRGGDINFQVGQESFTLSSNIDSIRIKKFFQDAPRGTAFINKQIGLQLTNPKIETGNTLFGLGQSSPVPGLLENTRVYNQGRNTLAQILASGTGAHAVRHGLTPFAPFQKNYYAIVNAQNVNNQGANNRLLNLTALKMTTGVSPFVNPENVLDVNLINTLGISLNRNLLFQYLGGPGSSYGVGNTTLPRYVDTTKTKNSRVMGYDLIRSQKVNNITEGSATTNIQDFRNQVFEQGNLNINDPNVRKTFAGRWVPEEGVDFRFFVKSNNGLSKVDAMNASYPFIFNNNTEPWTTQNDQSTDDLIKFVFECISNDNPSYSLAIFFRAHLTAGINDTNSADINSFRYLGRGENFYTYQGFQRSISFSFRMAAQSRQELIPMYNRLNSLISQVYPDYSDSGVMRAPLVRLTIGDYLYRMPGLLESVNVTVDNGYPWEVDLDKTLAQLPQVVDVSVSFKPILDELPKRTSLRVTETEASTTSIEDSATGLTTENISIDASVPKLIANKKGVIKNEEIKPQNYKTVREASQEEFDKALEQYEKRLDKRQQGEILWELTD